MEPTLKGENTKANTNSSDTIQRTRERARNQIAKKVINERLLRYETGR
jgi:hypothetical protein